MTYRDTLQDIGSIIISRVLGPVIHSRYQMVEEDTMMCRGIHESSLTQGHVQWSFRVFPPGRPPDRDNEHTIVLRISRIKEWMGEI